MPSNEKRRGVCAVLVACCNAALPNAASPNAASPNAASPPAASLTAALLTATLLSAAASTAAAATPTAAVPATAPAPATRTPPDLVLLHGRFYTVDPTHPWAQAVAVSGDRIIAVGSDDEVLPLRAPSTRVVDLQGRLVTPGLIDSHVHFTDGGFYLKDVALRDATTMGEVERRVADYARGHAHGDWIRGEGWSYGYPDLPNGEFHKELLDKASGDRPVFLDSSMAHAAWVNSAALRRAGITRATPNPPGGEIVHGPDGEPTGWLKEEAAIRLVQEKITPPTRAETKDALLAAIHEANRLGLTRVDSAGGDFPNLDLLAEIEREGALTLRISMADWIDPPGLTAEHLAILEAARSRHHDALLSCCVAKFLMDGVIESHTAHLPGGYADKPAEHGMRFFEPAAYKAAVSTLNSHGFQVYTHAIGDGAIKLALDAYENAERAGRDARKPHAAPGGVVAGAGTGAGDNASGAPSNATIGADNAVIDGRDGGVAGGNAAGARNRIEHAEAPDPEDIPRFGKLGVIASMQPLMIYPRDEWKGMEGLWQVYAGDKFLPQAFAIRSLLDAHATVAFGTDWPVVQLNPLLGLRNAVLRQSLDGQPQGGYVPAQRITLTEALRAYTASAAYGSRADDEGRIAPGKLADMAVFSKNFVEGPSRAIADAHVVMTLVGGKIVYEEN